MTSIRLLHCGPGTTIQDRGRFGWHRHGIASSGAADQLALAAANALVGNPLGMEAIELAFMGAVIEPVGGPVRLALAGARMPIRVDGLTVADHTSFVVKPGSLVEIGAAKRGVYAILAVEGGFAIPMSLGSRSLHRRAGIGGIDGLPLGAGHEVPLVFGKPGGGRNLAMAPLVLDVDRPLRTVPGPQQHLVTQPGIATFLSASFTIGNEVDRMACRLVGPAIELAGGYNIVSDGIVPGSIQIPGSGLPIIMLADRQTTGGYPKIATLVTPDIRYLVQRRSGDIVRFCSVSVAEAEALARTAAAELASLPRSVRPVGSTTIDTDRLLIHNLAGHASSACDPATWQP